MATKGIPTPRKKYNDASSYAYERKTPEAPRKFVTEEIWNEWLQGNYKRG